MILTIGMIVKNEEKYLRACLEAISPILKRLDSELIIADTGSEDSTVEIAKSFTDNVFCFEWCNDFAAARNSTVERARGEWYMQLDADEVFENVSEIIDFFRSGEYKKYNSATYIIRSVNDKAKTLYMDYDAPRMLRLREDSRYHNPIHEEIPCYNPAKKISSCAIHYGYLLEDNEEFLRNKSQRNLDLLFSELEKDPKNCKYYLEIGQVYDWIRDYKSALDYYEKGLLLAKEHKHEKLKSFYADIARVRLELKQFNEILKVTGEYFQLDKKKNPIDLQMYYLEALSYYELKRYTDAAVSYENYIKEYQKYHNNKYAADAMTQYVVRFTDHYNYRTSCLNLVHCCMEDKNYKSAAHFLKLIPITDWKEDDRGIQKRLATEINLMGEMKDYSKLPYLFRNLSGNHLIMFQNMIEQIVNDERRKLILSAIAGADLIQTDYIRLLSLRHRFYCENSLSKEDVEAFLSETGELSPLHADALYFALYTGLDISFLAKRIDSYDWERLLFTSKSLHFKDLPEQIYAISERNIDSEDPHTQQLLTSIYMWALKSGQLSDEQLINLFQAYANAAGHFLAAAYQKEFLTEANINLLPKNLRVGYYCAQVVNAELTGENDNLYVKNLKKILNLDPGLKEVIQILLNEERKRLEREDDSHNAVSEFEAYAAIVKTNIKKLIAEQKLNQAREIIKQYEQLCPNDSEIEDLKKFLL